MTKTYPDSFDACELRAGLRGMTGACAGHFPELPLPAAPTYVEDELANVIYLRGVRRAAARRRTA